jgi:hypothetical protein
MLNMGENMLICMLHKFKPKTKFVKKKKEVSQKFFLLGGVLNKWVHG